MLTRNNLCKGIIFTLIITLMISLSPAAFAAGSSGSGSGNIKLVVNGRPVVTDVEPQMIGGRIMIPVRWIAEPLGASVVWDEVTQSVLVDSSAIKVKKAADNTIQLFVSGKQIQPDVAPQVIDGRVMVPVRWAAEALGAIVKWDAATQTVDITKNKEGYGSVREIKKNGKVVLTLQPDELFIFSLNQRIYEYAPEAREKLIGQYIKKEFPGLKYKLVHWDENGIREQDFAENGVYPDIYIDLTFRNTTQNVKNWGMEYDISPLIEKYNFDLNRLNKSAMNVIIDRGAGSIYALPLEMDEFILYYNKTLFDNRQVSYPTFGMTYDEVFEKAKAITHQEYTRVIKGYSQHPDQYMQFNQRGYSPFSQSEPNKVVLATDGWLNLVNNLSRFYSASSIRGNVWNTTDDFFRSGICAMAVDTIQRLHYLALVKDYTAEDDRADWAQKIRDHNIGNWDISPVPVFADAPNSIYQPNTLGCFITKQSQMKETAFKVIANLLTDEVQLARSQDGLKGPVKTDEIANSFGANVAEYKNLNTKAIYWGENASITPRTPEVAGGGYWDIALWKVFRLYIKDRGIKPQTALERTEKEENQWIQDQITAGKKW